MVGRPSPSVEVFWEEWVLGDGGGPARNTGSTCRGELEMGRGAAGEGRGEQGGSEGGSEGGRE